MGYRPYVTIAPRIMLLFASCALLCAPAARVLAIEPAVLEGLRAIGSTEGFKPYGGNPIVTTGPMGSWDAGALGSVTVLRAKDLFHLYYESWGVRSESEWDADEYESLQIGHATSRDGIHWEKDDLNPVLPQGVEGDFDRTGVWDPYVIHENGLYKMWYGGGGGSQPNFGWAYAFSDDGSRFNKRGLIGIGNQTGCEDVHVVRNPDTGLYHLYYWHGWSEPEGLFLVTSFNETGFDFNEAVKLRIEGDDSLMCKFAHVLHDEDGWHMFYSNFVRPHCPNSSVRYATSDDGVHWRAANKRLLAGHDADVLRVADELYLMAYSPQNYFDRKDCDIRLAVYNGRLPDLARPEPPPEPAGPLSLGGKSYEVQLEEDWVCTLTFKRDSEVVIREEEDGEEHVFNAYYEQEGESVVVLGGGLELRGTYDGQTLSLSEVEE